MGSSESFVSAIADPEESRTQRSRVRGAKRVKYRIPVPGGAVEMGQGAVLNCRRDRSFVDEGTEVNPRRRRLVPRPARRTAADCSSARHGSRPLRRHVEGGQLRTRPALDPRMMQIEAPRPSRVLTAAIEPVAQQGKSSGSSMNSDLVHHTTRHRRLPQAESTSAIAETRERRARRIPTTSMGSRPTPLPDHL